MALTEKGKNVFEYVKEHDQGDGVLIADIAEGTGLTVKQVGPIIWAGLAKEGKDGRPALLEYKKIAVEGSEKPVGYVFLTNDGVDYEEENADAE